MKLKDLLTVAILGGSIMILDPKGMTLGTIDNNGSFMTTGPGGMALGTINPDTGSYFKLDKKGMSTGSIGKPPVGGLSIRGNSDNSLGDNDDD